MTTILSIDKPMRKYRGSEHSDFWERLVIRGYNITSDGCWEFRGPFDPHGYGSVELWVKGKRLRRLAHRVSYQQHVGSLTEGLDICHSCDNRKCVNPVHLFQGTRKDNMQDAKLKNRLIRADTKTGIKLTLAQRDSLVSEYRPYKVTARMLADKYGISYTYATHIIQKHGKAGGLG